MQRRRRWAGGAVDPRTFPIGETPDGWTATDPGAVVPLDQVVPDGGESAAYRRSPINFDFQPIVAAQASGARTQLIGPLGTVTLGAIPRDYRAVVDGIFPYLEAASGSPFAGPRITGTGVTITWFVSVDGKPVPGYGVITTIIAPWNRPSPRPLFEVQTGSVLTVDVQNIDPNGLYSYLGVRLTGRMIPIAIAEARL